MKRIYRPIVGLVVALLGRVARALPRRLALAWGELLGAAAYHLFPGERRRAVANLTLAFGHGRPGSEIAGIARDCFRTLGKSTIETLRLPAMSEEDILSVVDADPFAPAEAVLARGKGMIVLSAHVGAWEVLAAYLAARLGRPFHAIGRRLGFDTYNRMLVDVRRSHGVETVFQDEGARPALRVLRDNRALGVLGDQDVERLDGAFVDFFGRQAYTPTGPAALARASGAGMVPFFITWTGLRHRVHVLPEIELARSHDRQADVAENTRRWSKAVEDLVRRHPENWVWLHRRWREPAPAGEGRTG